MLFLEKSWSSVLSGGIHGIKGQISQIIKNMFHLTLIKQIVFFYCTEEVVSVNEHRQLWIIKSKKNSIHRTTQGYTLIYETKTMCMADNH